MSSALEAVRAALKSDLEGIVAGATYRNTVAAVYEDVSIVATKHPSLTLVFTPDMTVEPSDDHYETYNLHVPFTILAEVKAKTTTGTTSQIIAAQDSLLQDILRCISDNYNAHVTGTPRWNIQGTPNMKVTPIYPSGENAGTFAISGVIHIRDLDGTFE